MMQVVTWSEGVCVCVCVCVHVRSSDRVTLGLKDLGPPHGSICGSHDDDGSISIVFIILNDDGSMLIVLICSIGVQIRIQLKMMRTDHMGLERTFVRMSPLHRR